MPAISFVIAAFNAAGTVRDTLQSLTQQQYPDWEAVVVDDGSEDTTAAEVASAGDSRVRLLRQSHAGAASARNRGLQAAAGEWVVFLDADDWVSPDYAARMLGRAGEVPGADAIHCGWARVGADGLQVVGGRFATEGLLFDVLRERCVFAIHACMVRRQAVEQAGGFDTGLSCCEDWDLWQRLAHNHVRFAHVPGVLAFYRVRRGSVSMREDMFLRDAWRVVERGVRLDSTRTHPQGAHMEAAARPEEQDDLNRGKLRAAVWAAGLALGRGAAFEPIIDALRQLPPVSISGHEVAEALHGSLAAGAGVPLPQWEALWPQLAEGVAGFLRALEAATSDPTLARRSGRSLADRILASGHTAPMLVFDTYGTHLDAFAPIRDVRVPAGCDRVVLHIDARGVMEHVNLPATGAVVPAELIKDAATARAAWSLLGEFLQAGPLAALDITEADGNREVRRGTVTLASGPVNGQTLHDQLGWTVWLQDIWGKPEWPNRAFYRNTPDEGAPQRQVGDETSVEISETLPDLVCSGGTVRLRVTVGGATLGSLDLTAEGKRITSGRIRTVITSTFGMELCRAVVREAVLGHPLRDGATLRDRLAAASERRHANSSWYAAAEPAVSDVVARRGGTLNGTALSRRALLPADSRDTVLEAAAACGEKMRSCGDTPPGTVAYDPGLLPHLAEDVAPGSDTEAGGARFFELLFEKHEDPWNYRTPYEQLKYEQTLALLQGRRFPRVLELACAEGHFTERLAALADDLLATDVSPRALTRTAARCRALPQVRTARLDITREPLPGPFDLIVCSEVLYYVGGWDQLRAVARKISGALVPGGVLLTAHANLAREEQGGSGFTWDQPFGTGGIRKVLRATRDMVLVRELVTPLYRIGLFEKRPRRWWQPAPPVVEEAAAHAPLTAAVASQVRWADPSARPSAQSPVLSRQVPILMYHGVSPDAGGSLSRYRLTPEQFDAQLRFLADQGYHSIGLEAWRDAVEHRRNILGRPVIITFDDGFADFAEHAWPRLLHYGFGATLFVVSGHAGGTSQWDGDGARPLLDWRRLRQLRDQGLVIGAHSHNHAALTGLSVADIAREAARSRGAIAEALGEAVVAFAYPYGEHDAVVRHIVGACGFRFGLTVRNGLAGFGDDLLDLPRLEIHNRLTIARFEELVRL